MGVYTKNINRHSDVYITNEWDESSSPHQPPKPSSSMFIEAHKDNTDDLLIKINNKPELIPVVPGGARSLDSLSIKSVEVTNASSANKYHLELYLD